MISSFYVVLFSLEKFIDLVYDFIIKNNKTFVLGWFDDMIRTSDRDILLATISKI